MRKSKSESTSKIRLQRRGMVLVMAVILLTVVAFSAFQLSSWANSSLKVAVAIRQQIDLRVALESGVSQLCLRLRQGLIISGQMDDEATMMCAVKAGTADDPITVCAFRPVRARLQEERVYGFLDESRPTWTHSVFS